MNIVLLGGPGAGKGTLAKQLEEEYGYFLLSPGELYRKEADLGTEFGLKAKNEYWGAGNLCPDEMTNELVRKTVSGITESPGVVFDGYPRRRSQAEYLDSLVTVDLIFNIDVPEEVTVKRLLGRAVSENRPDDTEDIIKQRIEVYNKNNFGIIDYYVGCPQFHTIDGSGTPLDTFNIAKNIIESLS